MRLSGNDYEMGVKIGKTFRSFLQKKAEEKAEEIRKNRKILSVLKKKLKDYPSVLDEIKGRADGAEVSLEAMIYLLSPELSWKEDGCTTVMMIDKDGDILFSHNEDESTFASSNTAWVTYEYEDHWVAGYLCADKLLGSCFGVNSYGLLFSSNFIASHTIEKDSISRYILQRVLMDSRSLTDLKKRAKEVSIASPFSMNAVDIHKKKALNLEKDFDRIYVTELRDRYARSNHFLKKKGDVKITGTSLSRYELVKKKSDALKKETVTLKRVQNVTDYQGKDETCSVHLAPKKKGAQRTVANFSCSTKDGVLILRDFLGKKVYQFPFEEN